MTLKKEERDIMVGLELEKAYNTFSEYDGLTEKGYWNTLANRLYYALFHAVSSMLISDGHEVGSHRGAAIRFHQYYVRTGIFTDEEGLFYSQMQTLREKSDYNCFFKVAEADICARIEPTRAFIEKIKKYITHKQTQ
jgi:uncharacterized protein (UPF0332 family)